MAFKKGKSGNANGRPTGSANKATGDLRQWISTFIEGNKEQITADWQTLEPKDRIVQFERLLKYAVPTLQATTLNTDFDKLTDSQLDQVINELKNVTNE